jgi:hypothetical protein
LQGRECSLQNRETEETTDLEKERQMNKEKEETENLRQREKKERKRESYVQRKWGYRGTKKM